jgi:predicted PurR-regulated permease PerM
MIDLREVVSFVVYLLVAGGIFALLFFLVRYLERKFPSEPMRLFCVVAEVVLVVAAVLVLIGLLLSLVGLGSVFRWGPVP